MLAAVAALIPNAPPEIVPELALVAVRVALSEIPVAPPEREIVLVHVWLVPVVVHC
jgi:hypothetical protein